MAQEQTPSVLEDASIRSSDGVVLEGRLTQVHQAEGSLRDNAVLLLHGFPSGDVRADKIGGDMPQLCERISAELRWNALAIRFRGCGESQGNFSLAGWCDDASAAIDYLHERLKPRNIWVVGFGTGGTVGLVAAARSPRVAGAAVVGSPADFHDWADNPERLLRHAREVGVIKDSSYPDQPKSWQSELRNVRADEVAEYFPPRPLLILHGSDDDAVPHFDARLLADRHGDAELRIISGGGHQLRHDPRAISILLGWLDRQTTDGFDRDDDLPALASE